jgi:hypothetical protein
MANGWTSERRAGQADFDTPVKGVEQSIGPKTPDGKACVSQNA